MVSTSWRNQRNLEAEILGVNSKTGANGSDFVTVRLVVGNCNGKYTARFSHAGSQILVAIQLQSVPGGGGGSGGAAVGGDTRFGGNSGAAGVEILGSVVTTGVTAVLRVS